ncbi:DNA primase [Mycobacteroides abscessus]|uniref:DUF3987 domain-containing protein n=1 Tax=Mycobacteroides abscessus TaxID=36809 RepID=UPI000C2646CE|nr:DUF3987 domain-containing protein [Mycobacteroides abscessus]PVB51145.1 DNA primase [Mycobacteroides abscessus]RIR80141.1 DNA primase [Mycobacteroides abscessus]RIT30015.1 DNA primase [Mycobacteroides abscessus]RIT38043.1 DNA primase [Mycobacteroides abscessus]
MAAPVSEPESFVDNLTRYGLLPGKSEKRAPERSPAKPRDTENAWAMAALTDECRIMSEATQPGRNDQLNRSAFALGQLVPHLLDEQDVVDALTNAAWSASHNGAEPLTDSEIRATIRSGMNAGRRDPRYAPETSSTSTTMPSRVAVTEEADHPQASTFDVRPLEGGFWDARESLRTVYETAMFRMCSPWAVLAHCAARALTLVPPHIQLPPIVGGPGSLNWFGAVTAVSGGGKGAASATARELIDEHVHARTPGSGEGLIAAYGGRDDEGNPRGDDSHEALMFTVDEIDTLSAVGGRSGATIMPILRQAFSGETLGFAYRNKLPMLLAHTYRLTLVASIQPDRAGGLLADSGGGTPQRFMWFPGIDDRISASAPYPSGSIALPSFTDWQYPRVLTVPAECEGLIRSERVKAARGDTAALDGHALFCREKFAYALAVLDGRPVMSVADWELSGIAARVSDAVRQWVIDQLAVSEVAEASHKGRMAGVAREASDAEQAYQKQQRVVRVARVLLDKMPATEGALRKRITSRDRAVLDIALATLKGNELAWFDGDQWQKTGT